MAFLLILGALILPLIAIPFTMNMVNPAFDVMAGIMIIYAIPAALILIFLYIPALTIGLTRTYMILTAEDDYEETLEDETGPSFIGGV